MSSRVILRYWQKCAILCSILLYFAALPSKTNRLQLQTSPSSDFPYNLCYLKISSHKSLIPIPYLCFFLIYHQYTINHFQLVFSIAHVPSYLCSLVFSLSFSLPLSLSLSLSLSVSLPLSPPSLSLPLSPSTHYRSVTFSTLLQFSKSLSLHPMSACSSL